MRPDASPNVIDQHPVAGPLPMTVVVANCLGEPVRWMAGRLLQGRIRVVTLLAEPAAPALLAQDAAAMRMLGIQACRRSIAAGDLARVTDLVAEEMAGADEFWLPAHGESALARAAREAGLAGAMGGRWSTTLFGGQNGDARQHQPGEYPASKKAPRLDGFGARPEFYHLSDAARSVKDAALARYEVARGPAQHDGVEVAWRLTPVSVRQAGKPHQPERR